MQETHGTTDEGLVERRQGAGARPRHGFGAIGPGVGVGYLIGKTIEGVSPPARAARRSPGHDVPRPRADGGDHVLRAAHVVRRLLHRLTRCWPVIARRRRPRTTVGLIKPDLGLMHLDARHVPDRPLHPARSTPSGGSPGCSTRVATRSRRTSRRPSRRGSRRRALLEEYSQQLAAARHESSEILERARARRRGAAPAAAGGARRRARARRSRRRRRPSRPRRGSRSTASSARSPS